MYKTAKEAGEEAARIAARYNGMQFVVVEWKTAENAGKTFYGFRCLVHEEFSGEWRRNEDRSFCGMIEIV
ncbi:MAG: hypothetical protein LBL45_07540 [Treponema sp.]|jgi:hypothetical protein|nr:hypothetical protein [Treponema sp.]